MSVSKLSGSLWGHIGIYASSTTQELANITCLSKFFRSVAYTKIHPHLLSLYAKEPSLAKDVAEVRQIPKEEERLSALFRKNVQGVKDTGGESFFVVLSQVKGSLEPTRLAGFATWIAIKEAESMEIFFHKATYWIPQAVLFSNGLTGSQIEKAASKDAWLEENQDLWRNRGELDIARDNLTILPEKIGLLTNLRDLRLQDNALRGLPTFLGNLSMVDMLLLSHNKLRELPTSLGNLTRLKILDLENNQLRVLPTWLGNLTELERLLLENNRLETLPASMTKLISLKELYLKGNPIDHVPRQLKTSNIAAIRDNPVIMRARQTPSSFMSETPEETQFVPSPPSPYQQVADALYACWSWVMQQVAWLVSWVCGRSLRH